MKKTILTFIIASFIITSCAKKEDNFISDLTEKTEKTNTIKYDLTQKYYYSNGQDTVITPCEVWIVRDAEDKLRNGYIWINDYYRPYNMIYDKGSFYLAIPPKKITALYPNYTEDFISEVDWIDGFLQPEVLQKQFLDPLNISSLSDTIYNGEECKKVLIEFPVGEKNGKKSHSYIFSKKHLTPRWALAKTVYEDHIYYDEIFFDNYEFENVNLEELRERQKKVIADNPVEDRTENSELSMLESMLHRGVSAPIFKGKFYSDNRKFELSEYIGKNIIIVDFWYTHCPPCVKAMPSLIELYNENKDAGLKIFGVNSVDNQAHSLSNLDKFLSKRKVSYDIIMIEPEVDLKYKIKQYPTLYIIDKEGKIAFVEIGYNTEKFEKLKEKVKELLQ